MKRKNYRDPSLVDEGWNRMKSALDREMPEKKRWRAFIWWPVLAAASVAGFFLLTLPNGVDGLEHQSAERQLTIVDSPLLNSKGSEGSLTRDEEVGKSVAAETVRTTADVKFGTTVPGEKGRSSGNKVTFSPVKSQIDHPEPNYYLAPREIQVLPVISIEDVELAYIPTSEKIAVNYIRTSLTQDSKTEKISVQNHKPTVTPEITISSGTYLPLSRVSWIGGPSLRISWKKMFLSPALEFWNINTRKSFLLNETTKALYETERIRNTSFDATNVAQPGGEAYSEYHVDHINYLKTSIRTGYISKSRISPYIGISAVFLVNDNITYSTGSSSFFSNNTSAMTEMRDILRRSNIASDIGVNYQLSPKFALSLNYTHPWRSYLNPEVSYASSTNISRQLMIGIRFQFD